MPERTAPELVRALLRLRTQRLLAQVGWRRAIRLARQVGWDGERMVIGRCNAGDRRAVDEFLRSCGVRP